MYACVHLGIQNFIFIVDELTTSPPLKQQQLKIRGVCSLPLNHPFVSNFWHDFQLLVAIVATLDFITVNNAVKLTTMNFSSQ